MIEIKQQKWKRIMNNLKNRIKNYKLLLMDLMNRWVNMKWRVEKGMKKCKVNIKKR